jgi:hypothetical protein
VACRNQGEVGVAADVAGATSQENIHALGSIFWEFTGHDIAATNREPI